MDIEKQIQDLSNKCDKLQSAIQKMINRSNILDMFKSKKLLVSISGLVFMYLEKSFNLEVAPETKSHVVQIIMAYVVGQGVADLGKEKVKTEQKINALKTD